MTCLRNSPHSSGLSSELVERYRRAVSAWRATSGPSTTSSGPAAASRAGSNPPGAGGSTTSSPGLSSGRIGGRTDIFERLAALALASEATQDGPPIRTYRSRPGVDGTETVVATEEYRQWFCRTYGVARDEVPRAEERAARAAGERAAEAGGGGALDRFKRKTP